MPKIDAHLERLVVKESAVEKRLREIEEETGTKIEAVKYHFSDMLGTLKEVTKTREGIGSKGIGSTDGSSAYAKVLHAQESGIRLLPNPETVHALPWRPNVARVICNAAWPIKEKGGEMSYFEGCPRTILQSVEESIDKIARPFAERMYVGRKKNVHIRGIDAHFAPEVEFFLRKGGFDDIKDDPNFKNDHYYLPLSQSIDEILLEMVNCLAQMGMKKEQYHAEVARYQYEIGIGHGNIVDISDATMTLKYIISQIAEKHGLVASFSPKLKKGINGCGMHTHQNLSAKLVIGDEDVERNMFYLETDNDCLSPAGKNYFAGQLRRAMETVGITNMFPISYDRLEKGCEAPRAVNADWENRTAEGRGHDRWLPSIRLEWRSPDPLANVYYANGVMLAAGLDGMKNRMRLPPMEKRDYYSDKEGVQQLPESLEEAAANMKNSRFMKQALGTFAVRHLHKLMINAHKAYNKRP